MTDSSSTNKIIKITFSIILIGLLLFSSVSLQSSTKPNSTIARMQQHAFAQPVIDRDNDGIGDDRDPCPNNSDSKCTTSPCDPSSGTIMQGDEGPKVAEIQIYLTQLGYGKLLGKHGNKQVGIDGYFQSDTGKAVIKFQQDKHLQKIDGKVGPETWPALCAAIASVRPPSRPAVNIDLTDSDGDDLLDTWETNGIDINNDGVIDLDLPGQAANPKHKDIFVEVDFMKNHTPHPTVVRDLIASFDKAPVPNPDGTTGITLHIELSNELPHQPTFDKPDVVQTKQRWFGSLGSSPVDIDSFLARSLVYHYFIFAHDQPLAYSGNSGVTYSDNGVPTMNTLITLGTWGLDPVTGHGVGSIDEQEGTFMHELGHQLMLKHGGPDENNCKPNYLSVMSYTFQFSDLISNRPLDYSKSKLETLDENDLSEWKGVSMSVPVGLMTMYAPNIPIRAGIIPVDWNNDGGISFGKIPPTNINAVNKNGCLTGNGTELVGNDDWNSIVYSFPAKSLKLLIIGTKAIEDMKKTLEDMFGAASEAGVGADQIRDEQSIQDIRSGRSLHLQTINEFILKLPDSALSTHNTEARKILNDMTNPESSNLANSLSSDDLKGGIEIILQLRSLTDSSVGGSADNDLIVSSETQQKLIPIIDNFIVALEKQGPGYDQDGNFHSSVPSNSIEVASIPAENATEPVSVPTENATEQIPPPVQNANERQPARNVTEVLGEANATVTTGEQPLCSDGLPPDPSNGLCADGLPPPASNVTAPPPAMTTGEQPLCSDGLPPDPSNGLCADGLPPPASNVTAPPPAMTTGEQPLCSDGLPPDPSNGLCADGLPPPASNVTAPPPAMTTGEQPLCSDGLPPDPSNGLCADGLPPASP